MKIMGEAVPTGVNGKGPGGRFLPGNKAAQGYPVNRKAQQLRGALMRAVTAGDVREVVKKLVDQAKGGDTTAARLLLDRLLGPAVAADIEERLAVLEERLGVSDDR